MKLFTVDEVSQLTAVNPQLLRNWVAGGLLRPTRPGTTGSGRGHRFGFVQVVAVAAGVRHRTEGAGPERATGVMRFLAGLTLEQLEWHLGEGRTFAVPAALVRRAADEEGLPATYWVPGLLIEPPGGDPSVTPAVNALMDRLDIKRIYDEVRARAAEIASRPEKKPTRRPRGREWTAP